MPKMLDYPPHLQADKYVCQQPALISGTVDFYPRTFEHDGSTYCSYRSEKEDSCNLCEPELNNPELFCDATDAGSRRLCSCTPPLPPASPPPPPRNPPPSPRVPPPPPLPPPPSPPPAPPPSAPPSPPSPPAMPSVVVADCGTQEHVVGKMGENCYDACERAGMQCAAPLEPSFSENCTRALAVVRRSHRRAPGCTGALYTHAVGGSIGERAVGC